MSRIYYNTVSGMDLELKRQDILAANLAASSIPGYKNEFVVSSSYKDDGAINGVGTGKTKIDYSQGELKRTDRRLDFAIQGEGFFKVRSSDGKTMYTRNGAFSLSKDMTLVTDNGFTVLSDADSAIQFSPDDNLGKLEIMPDGTLKIMGEPSQNYAYRQLGKLGVAQISNKEELERLTGNYFQMKPDTPPKAFPAPKEFTVVNSMLENSNASAMKSMTALIQSSREFEMSNRILKTIIDLGNREQASFQS